jgi:hypothetical protein
MRFGEIIKKAWNITWRYRALWVLGLFAGVTGGGGAGGNFSSGYNGGSNSGSGLSSGSNPFDTEAVRTAVTHWLPAVIVGVALLLVIGFAFSIIGIGARGGLVWAVNEIEEGRRPRLGEAWDAGFAKFWSLVALGFMIGIPLLVGWLVLILVVFVPIAGALAGGRTPGAAAALVVPMCGVLAIGVPVLIVASLVLGVMHITSMRFIVLEDSRASHALGESWHALRARFGDHVIMYLLNIGLNLAASLVLVIPILIVVFAAVIPAILAGAAGHWGSFAVVLVVMFLLLVVVGFAYSAIWGTFTSALWTIFYRRLTGREPLAAPVMPLPATVYTPPAPPAAPGAAPAWAPPAPAAPPTTPSAWAAPAPPAPPAPPSASSAWPPPAPPMYAPPASAAPPEPPAPEEPPPHADE